jgi:hypothetical protein
MEMNCRPAGGFPQVIRLGWRKIQMDAEVLVST